MARFYDADGQLVNFVSARVPNPITDLNVQFRAVDVEQLPFGNIREFEVVPNQIDINNNNNNINSNINNNINNINANNLNQNNINTNINNDINSNINNNINNNLNDNNFNANVNNNNNNNFNNNNGGPAPAS